MIVEIQYKTIFIKITFENELSVKIENLKKSLRSSLQQEMISYEKSIKNLDHSNDNKEIKYTSNSKSNSLKYNYLNNNDYINHVKDLLSNEDKFNWRLFDIDSNTEIPVEKKDEDYIKVKESVNQDKESKIIKLLLSKSYKKENSFNNKIYKANSSEDTAEMIKIMTGASEKIKVEEKDKKKPNNLLFNDPDQLIQSLMGLNSNSGEARVAFIQDLLGVRINPNPIPSSSSNNGTNPRINVQNRIFQSILNLGSSRPPIINTTQIPIVTPNQAKLQQLLEMGFAEDRARRALIMTRNNLEAAVEVIANEQDLTFEEPNNQSQSSNNNLNSQDLNDDHDEEIHIDEIDDEDV